MAKFKLKHSLEDLIIRLFKEKPTLIRARQIFIFLYDNDMEIPDDVTEMVVDGIRDQVDSYPGDGLFESTDRERDMVDLILAIQEKDDDVPQAEIFRQFARRWGVEDTESQEGWQLVKDRYKSFLRG